MLKQEVASEFSKAVLSSSDLSKFSGGEILAFATGWAFEWMHLVSGKAMHKGKFYAPVNSKKREWEKLSDLLINTFKGANHRIYYENMQLKNLLSYCFLNTHDKKGALSSDEEAAFLCRAYVCAG